MLNRPLDDLTLTNARIVLAGETITGTVHVKGGLIHDVATGATGVAGAVDMGGDHLMPGFVELHTDHLESQMRPRPGVRWPPMAALAAHDAQVAASGITTVFDALCCGFTVNDRGRSELLAIALDTFAEASRHGHLRADHRLHLRCEVSDPKVMEHFEPAIARGTVSLVSIMDHTPGQRQFNSIEGYKDFYMNRYGLSEQEVEETIEVYRHGHLNFAEDNRRTIVEAAKARGIALASHDDETEAHIDEAVELGIGISEFPTTLAAARAARAKGMATVGGAPNVVRGGSHSGNVSVADLAHEGVLDALSSDYVPLSLIQAMAALRDREGLDLAAAVRLISLNPARMAGLDDRGAIEPGLRADLVRVAEIAGFMHICQVWRQGERVI